MAAMVQSTHLSLTDAAPETAGILYEPADVADATAAGGWAGRSRTAGRLVLAGTVAAVGVAVLGPRIAGWAG